MRLRRSRPDLEDPDAPARPRKRRLSLKKGKDRGFKCVRTLGSNWAQIVAYLVSICLFQALFGEMRQPSEYMFYKHITDLLLEAPFTDGGNQDDIFMGIGEVGDIHTYADKVMWPALLKDRYPRDETSDGDESHAFFTPTELAVRMDTFDWTAGISFKWNRVSAAPESKCKPTLDTHHNKIFQQLWTADQQDTVVKAPRANHHGCYPDIHSRNMGPVQGDQETAPYGRNWTHPESELTHPFLFQTSAELNSNPDGQPSASVVINWGTVPTDGYAAFVIPFFSDEFLEDETKEWTEDSKSDERLADYRMFSARHSDTPKFFCVRLAWSTDWVRQLCDPNDEFGRTSGAVGSPNGFGRTTGKVPDAIREFWANLQRARWIDPFTRMVTITMPLRNNNAAIRFRLSLMMQLTSQGAVVPSYDVESRFDAADPILIKVILTITLILVIYFILLEFRELKEEGPIDYFNNMWNLMARLAPMTPLAVAQRTHAREAHSSCPLAAVAVPHAGAQDTLEPPHVSQDWANFAIYFALYIEYQRLDFALNEFGCEKVCTRVGFHDPWKVMLATTNCKQLLAILTTIQWLKVIKYINGVVPKFALATSVLSHGLADLLMFFVFFCWSIISFSQLFFMQLGPYMEGYATLLRSMITLARALFGDFDMESVINISNGWLNAMFFIAYLFVAVFILLSIFLTILGEHQGYVREEDPSLNSWGVIGKMNTYIERKRDIILNKMGAGGSRKNGTLQSDPGQEQEEDTDEVPPAVTQLASLSRDGKPAAETDGGACNGGPQQTGGLVGTFPSLWAAKTSLEKLDDKTHELSSAIEELEASGADPEKLAQLQEDLSVVKQLQTARLIQKAEELRNKNLGEDSDIPEAPRRHGLFGTMPRPVDTKALAHDVAKIKAMLSRQEAMLKQLLGERPEGDDASGGAIATMRLQSRSRQGSGIRQRKSGQSGSSEQRDKGHRSKESKDTGPAEAGAEGQRAPAIVLRRSSPDSERQHSRALSEHSGVSGVSGASSGAQAPVEPVRERRSTGSGRERRHTSSGSPQNASPGGEQIPPTTPGERSGERRSSAAKQAQVFSTVQSTGV